MDFGALPPEVNSGRMYTGPGSGSMVAAAAAWDGLAAEMRSTADSYASVIAGLTNGSWLGPSSAAMAAAAAPYAAWMSATAAQAEQTATQARAAATAYETAFAATVPPPVIAANRSQLASLVATNIFGQNTAAIAATEAQYGDMWAQDAAAMYGYAGSSATAAQVTPFTPPPQTTNPAGAAGQAAAVTQAAGTSAGNAQSTLTQLMSAVPQTLQSAAAPAASDPNLLSAFLAFITGSTDPATQFSTLSAYVQAVPKLILPANDVMITAIYGFVSAVRGLQSMLAAGTGAAASSGGSALAAGLGSGVHALGSVGLGGAGSAVSAGMGSSGLVGALSVPPSWAAATPTVRLAAAVLQGTGLGAAPAVSVDGSLFSDMALASLAGSALGGAAPRAISGTVARVGRPTTDKDDKTPDKLKRVLAELSQKPESVQHWHTDPTQLESLLARLSKTPGVHAVHLSTKDKANPGTPKPRSL